MSSSVCVEFLLEETLSCTKRHKLPIHELSHATYVYMVWWFVAGSNRKLFHNFYHLRLAWFGILCLVFWCDFMHVDMKIHMYALIWESIWINTMRPLYITVSLLQYIHCKNSTPHRWVRDTGFLLCGESLNYFCVRHYVDMQCRVISHRVITVPDCLTLQSFTRLISGKLSEYKGHQVRGSLGN